MLKLNRKKTLLLLAIVLVTAGGLFLLPDDEKKIRANLGDMAQYCTTSEEEAVLESLQKAARAANLCTNPCRVTIQSLPLDDQLDQKGLIDHILLMKKNLPATTFSFGDTAIALPGKDRAEISTILQIEGDTVDGRFTDAYQIQITGAKIEGGWLFSSFTVVEFMEQ